jgi:hypothetical protein
VPLDVIKTRLQTSAGKCTKILSLCLPQIRVDVRNRSCRFLPCCAWLTTVLFRLAVADKGMLDAGKRIVSEEGLMMLTKGAGPTAVGYFAQGAFKFGFNEFFKKEFSLAAGPENAVKYRLPIWSVPCPGFIGFPALAESHCLTLRVRRCVFQAGCFCVRRVHC